jgi:5-methylcytosine-specific restriction endonuclease McrA
MRYKIKSIKGPDIKSWLVYKKDGFNCMCCGEKDINKLELYRLVPYKENTFDSIYDYLTLCNKCNRKKNYPSSSMYGLVLNHFFGNENL